MEARRYPPSWRRSVWLSPYLLAVVLTPAFLQVQYTCDRGDTTLASLEVEVSGVDQIDAFASALKQYVVIVGADTVVLRAQAQDPAASVYYQLRLGGALLEAGALGVGGGEVTLAVPVGHVDLKVDVRPPQGGFGFYDVDIARLPAPDISSVVLAQEDLLVGSGSTSELDFYGNPAYECGLSGNYTFLVIEPGDNPGAEAPLWVYLHGGGVGYYNDLGVYVAVKNQTEDTYNHEETFTDLLDDQVVAHTLDNANQPIDSTLKRRIEEGYRVLVVSLCDHDLYSGLGTPYPNNPNPDASVDGLPATMAAIEYTVANYPTTHVFAHGTSAGSLGVWALAISYGVAGHPLTGVVADSWIATTRILTTAAAFSGEPGYPFGSDFDVQGVSDKVGFFVGEDLLASPEAELADRDFRDVPVLFIAGNNDPFCGGNQAPLAEAVAEGLSNCNWLHDGLRQRIDAQVDSPHELHVLNGFGHVPTNGEGPVNDIVDTFITDILSTNPPHPFAP